MKYRVTVSTTEERDIEAPNALTAAARAVNGDRTATVEAVKSARGRPTGNMQSPKQKRKATPAQLKNLTKARAVRKRNVAAAKKKKRAL